MIISKCLDFYKVNRLLCALNVKIKQYYFITINYQHVIENDYQIAKYTQD